jgi:hypothetical protein
LRKRVVLLELAAAASLLACGSGGGGVSIQPYWVHGGVVVADFNADGRADVAVAARYIAAAPPHPGYVNVYLRNAAGGFDAPVQYAVAADPWGLSAGDFDGNGGLDLVAATPSTVPPQINTIGDSGAISILRHDPIHPGRFLPASSAHTGGAAEAAAIASLTGDSRPDIMVADGVQVNGRALLLEQDATHAGALLPPVAISVGANGSEDIAVGDLNGDGLVDVVLAAGDSVAILYQRPGGGFDVVRLPAGQRPEGVAVADLDGDGRLDVAVANAGNAPAGGTGGASITILLQTAPGLFAPTNITVADGARRLAIGDLNGDGLPDVAAVSLVYQALSIPARITVLLQSATRRGHFAAPVVYDGPLNGNFIALGDVNGDGRTDIVINDGPSVLLQSSAAPGTFGPAHPLR